MNIRTSAQPNNSNGLMIYRYLFLFVLVFISSRIHANEEISLTFSDSRVLIDGRFSKKVTQIDLLIDGLVAEEGTIQAHTVRKARPSLFSLSLVGTGVYDTYYFDEGQSKTVKDGIKHQGPSIEFSYDALYFYDVCLRSSNHQMALLLQGIRLGTVNAAHPTYIVFIYFDDVTNSISRRIVPFDEWSGKGCLEEAIAEQTFARKAKQAETEIFDRKMPLPVNFESKSLADGSRLPIIESAKSPLPDFEKHFRTYETFYLSKNCSRYIDSEDIPNECIKVKHGMTLVKNTDDFAIHRVHTTHHEKSNGIDFLHNKRHNKWYSFYRIPSSGVKYFLFVPRYNNITENHLYLDLCSYCMSWGEWQSYRLNLDNFKIAKIDRTESK